MLFSHWLPCRPSAARKGPELSSQSGIPGNRHTAGNLENWKLQYTLSDVLWTVGIALWLIATWIFKGQSLPVNPQPSHLRPQNERAFLANQTQPNCYRACYFQWCLDSGVRGRSYQDLKNLVCKHQERKASLVWPCKHPLPLSMFLMSLTPPTLSTRSSIPSISRTSEFWALSFPSGCSTWYMRTVEGG